MREILFRGKAINRDEGYHRTEYQNGEWVYGLVTKLYDEQFKNLPAEMTNTNGISGIKIDYKTIGQYTGMKDKNGKKIFEGDIVRNKNKYFQFVGIVKYQNGQFLVDWKLHQRISEKVISSTVTHHLGNVDEVIGNIFDNQQLLKQGGIKYVTQNLKYVPQAGKAHTVAGELLRATARIYNRYYNDGDMINKGYGKETCNKPAHYLWTMAGAKVKKIIDKMKDSDYDYEEHLEMLITEVVNYIKLYPELETVYNGWDSFIDEDWESDWIEDNKERMYAE